MKKNNETKTISELISNSAFEELKKSDRVKKLIKYSTIFSFWKDIVGVKFSNFTKPQTIKGAKLYVSAKSPIIIQELNLYKKNILKKLNSYSQPLDIKIEDIIFDYKNFKNETIQENNQEEDKPIWLKEENLSNVEIDENFSKEIKKHISKINLLNQEQKEKLIGKILKNEQAKNLQNKTSI